MGVLFLFKNLLIGPITRFQLVVVNYLLNQQLIELNIQMSY